MTGSVEPDELSFAHLPMSRVMGICVSVLPRWTRHYTLQSGSPSRLESFSKGSE